MKKLDLFEADLVARLKAAEAAYYNGSEIMEDDEYDILRDQLSELNPNHPHLANVGAPFALALGFTGSSVVA